MSARKEEDSLALKQYVHFIWSAGEIYFKKKASDHECCHVLQAELQHLSNASAQGIWQSVNLSDFVSVASGFVFLNFQCSFDPFLSL